MVQGLLLVCRSMNENLVLKSTKIVALSFRLVLNVGARKNCPSQLFSDGEGDLNDPHI